MTRRRSFVDTDILGRRRAGADNCHEVIELDMKLICGLYKSIEKMGSKVERFCLDSELLLVLLSCVLSDLRDLRLS